MDRHAGGLADRHHTRHDSLRIALTLGDDLTVQVGGNPAHVVVHGRQHRDRLARHVDTAKILAVSLIMARHFGRIGCVWRETDAESADRKTLIRDLVNCALLRSTPLKASPVT